MTSGRRHARAATAAITVASMLLCASPAPAEHAERYAGRPLADVLRSLQAEGLRIVFSSAIVTPDLRVRDEPRAASARRRLDQLLAPHGLAAQEGPSGTIQIVRVRRDAPAASASVAPLGGQLDRSIGDASPPSLVHREHVVVNEPPPQGRLEEGAAVLGREQLDGLRGSFGDDPVRAVHLFPGVWAPDDFASEFAVRASAIRHVGVVVDGAPTHRLTHRAPGRGNSASLGMLAGQVLETATLRAGAFPRRYDDTLGAELELTIREGNRSAFHMRGMLSGTSALVLGEGPLGRSARGSWLIAGRQSYAEWPRDATAQRPAFGFSDVVAKAVYDVPRGQVGISLVTGLTGVDGEERGDGSEGPDGADRASMANLSWRSTIGGSTVLSHSLYAVRHTYVDGQGAGSSSPQGGDDQLGYRATLLRPFSRGVLETGAEVTRTAVQELPGDSAALAPLASWTHAAYAHVTWSLTPRVRISQGLRVSGSTLVEGPMTSPWLQTAWEFSQSWTLAASAGLSHQAPPPAVDADVWARQPPERASHVDVGIENRLRHSVRWRATLFHRRERDVASWPGLLRGSASGIEMLVDRRSPTGLSGWAAYSYGLARHTDTGTGETFWSDNDQRHTLSLFGSYRFSPRTGVGVTFRTGSNVPIPGYFAQGTDGLVLTPRRNGFRLPPYARLDVRGERGVEVLGFRMTAFAEVLNVLDRFNVGPAEGAIDPSTEATRGLTTALIRRRVLGGLAVGF